MEWRKRRERDFFEDIFRDIFESFRQFETELERMMDEMMKAGGARMVGPYYYGVRITIGPDGIPRVEEFGNIRRLEGGRKIISEEIEPLVDVIDADDEIWIVAELPGVQKDNIKVKIRDNKVIIKASNGKRYYKEVELPAEVDPKSAKAKYNNGVLHIKIKKKEAKKEEKGFEVEVE